MRVILDTDRVVGFGAIQNAGDAIELNDDEALRLLESGQAHVETAMDEPRLEFAAHKRRKRVLENTR